MQQRFRMTGVQHTDCHVIETRKVIRRRERRNMWTLQDSVTIRYAWSWQNPAHVATIAFVSSVQLCKGNQTDQTAISLNYYSNYQNTQSIILCVCTHDKKIQEGELSMVHWIGIWQRAMQWELVCCEQVFQNLSVECQCQLTFCGCRYKAGTKQKPRGAEARVILGIWWQNHRCFEFLDAVGRPNVRIRSLFLPLPGLIPLQNSWPWCWSKTKNHRGCISKSRAFYEGNFLAEPRWSWYWFHCSCPTRPGRSWLQVAHHLAQTDQKSGSQTKHSRSTISSAITPFTSTLYSTL